MRPSYTRSQIDMVERLSTTSGNDNFIIEDMRYILTKKQFEVFKLKYDGYKGKDIVKRLKISPTAVSLRLKRAKEKILEYVKNGHS